MEQAIHPDMPGSVSMLSDSVSAGMVRTSEVNGHQSEMSGALPVLSDPVSAGRSARLGCRAQRLGYLGRQSGGRGSESTRSGSAESHWPLPEFFGLPLGKALALAVSPVGAAQHHFGHRQLGVER